MHYKSCFVLSNIFQIPCLLHDLNGAIISPHALHQHSKVGDRRVGFESCRQSSLSSYLTLLNSSTVSLITGLLLFVIQCMIYPSLKWIVPVISIAWWSKKWLSLQGFSIKICSTEFYGWASPLSYSPSQSGWWISLCRIYLLFCTSVCQT